MFNFNSVAVPLLASVAIPGILPFSVLPPPPVSAPPRYSIIKEFDTETTASRKVATEPKEKRLICKDCHKDEQIALDFLQDKGIKDKNALATIMGNIKQESTFAPDICEGGYRASYHRCRYGGYGLLQWTTDTRYYGLGDFARRYGGDPSDLRTQLNYMLSESQWKGIENKMKTPGLSIYSYMRSAYYWIGWGYHGARTEYAYNYSRRFTLAA